MQKTLLIPLSLSVCFRPVTLSFACALLLLFVYGSHSAQAQGRVAVVRDAEIEELLKDYAIPILKAAGLSRRGIEIVLVNDPSFNAFVSDRRIFINTGTILASATPNETIGVLAHEAGHLAGGHQQRLREQIARAQTMAIVGSLIGAGAVTAGSVAGSRSGAQAGGALITAVPTAVQRMILSYRRSEEMNADQAAGKYLNATKQSAQGMLETFKRFSSALALSGVQVNPYQLSHPLPQERIALLETLARQSPYFGSSDSKSLMERHQLARAKIAAYMDGQPGVARLFERGSKTLAARYGDAIATDLAGNSRASLEKMNALIKSSPRNAYFHEFRGEVLLKMGKSDDAVKSLAQALKLTGGRDALIKARYGFALLTTGKPADGQKAIEYLQAAVRADPGNLNAYVHLSQAFGLSGDIGNAELAMAEGHFHAGTKRDAKVFAARALTKLPKGTPAAKRANDILSVGK